MTRSDLLRFLRAQPWAVEASVNGEGKPEAAVIGVAVNEKLELAFDTLSASRKAANLRGNPRIALVIGWDDAQTVQIEGLVDEPTGDELQNLKNDYLMRFPDGQERAALADVAYFRVTPVWIRYSDFRSAPSTVIVFDAKELQRLVDGWAAE
jgi:general stress protein 26